MGRVSALVILVASISDLLRCGRIASFPLLGLRERLRISQDDTSFCKCHAKPQVSAQTQLARRSHRVDEDGEAAFPADYRSPTRVRTIRPDQLMPTKAAKCSLCNRVVNNRPNQVFYI